MSGKTKIGAWVAAALAAAFLFGWALAGCGEDDEPNRCLLWECAQCVWNTGEELTRQDVCAFSALEAANKVQLDAVGGTISNCFCLLSWTPTFGQRYCEPVYCE